MILQDKVCVIYGASGAVGNAVAQAFAREGARVFLTGRRLAAVEACAGQIVESGGVAEAAEVDALDEQSIERHLQSVIDKAGRIDISFNAIGLPNAHIVGVPLIELDARHFTAPVTDYALSYFLTARLAARRMLAQRAGVIMTVSALPARIGTRLNGGYGAAMAAKEALTRDLSAELAPQGLRVVALRPHGLPESPMMKELFTLKPTGMSWEQFQGFLANMTHPRRTMTLAEMANVAAFVASDKASALTGTTVNMTMGNLDD